ncbi:MAG: hypothetical protein L6Q76_10720 [Polyangiaceae bacterium]|nr:hypothetical protein [Polyangiaceae bacterium]
MNAGVWPKFRRNRMTRRRGSRAQRTRRAANDPSVLPSSTAMISNGLPIGSRAATSWATRASTFSTSL